MSARRRRGDPRCRDCHAVVKFFRAAVGGGWRPFDPRPVDRNGAEQRVAYPVENGLLWWRPRELVEDLIERRAITRDEASTEADAMTPHVCLHGHPEEDPLSTEHDQPHATQGGPS